ncbi:MAG: NUDIX domain-containing protein [bacterium]|nr:NUDIX domain-containing protein [bacterium]
MDFDKFIGIENNECKSTIKRLSVRTVTKHNENFLMLLTNRGDLIFPGGGVEKDEGYEDAAIRELMEETGYKACNDIRYLGRVVTRKPDKFDKACLFESEMYFYKCNVKEEREKPKLSLNEIQLDIKPKWMTKEEIIKWNRCYNEKLEYNDIWVEMVEFVLEKMT